jgi:hypothetical protein
MERIAPQMTLELPTVLPEVIRQVLCTHRRPVPTPATPTMEIA